MPETPQDDEQWWKDHVEPRIEQLEREKAQGGSGGAVASNPSKRG